jgi:hypothetical protein
LRSMYHLQESWTEPSKIPGTLSSGFSTCLTKNNRPTTLMRMEVAVVWRRQYTPSCLFFIGTNHVKSFARKTQFLFGASFFLHNITKQWGDVIKKRMTCMKQVLDQRHVDKFMKKPFLSMQSVLHNLKLFFITVMYIFFPSSNIKLKGYTIVRIVLKYIIRWFLKMHQTMLLRSCVARAILLVLIKEQTWITLNPHNQTYTSLLPPHD